MRIATWNINSVRARVDRVVEFLQRWDIDTLAIQETKCKTEQFPIEPFTQAGYEVVAHGINQWNGVAIISRVGITNPQISFPGQPAFKDIVEARALGAVCGGINIWSLYIPHGRDLNDPHYAYKLGFLDALNQNAQKWLDEGFPFVLVGDWNVAPFDKDVWDIAEFAGATHVSQRERDAFNAFAHIGMREVTRDLVDNYTFWDYKQLRFPKNQGMRIDFVYASPNVADATVAAYIDRDERKGKGASDHVPVIVDVDKVFS